MGGLNLLQADYDNDGHLDILVLRGAWNFHNGRHPNSLLRNQGDGTFIDVTFEAGLGTNHYPTQTASWADYDHDGDLDLYLGNESFPGATFPCELFRNNGPGADGRVTFTEMAGEAGARHVGFTKAVIWGDYDGDRWPDLYISNYNEPNSPSAVRDLRRDRCAVQGLPGAGVASAVIGANRNRAGGGGLRPPPEFAEAHTGLWS